MFEAQDRLFGSWKEEGFGPEDLGEYGILLSEGEKIILPKPITPFPRGKTTNVPLPPIGEKAPEVLKNIIGLMGFSAETESTAHEGRLVLTLVGGDSSLLIGRRGVGLDSLELLLNKIIREDRPGDAPEGFGEEFRNDGDDADDPNDPDDADLSDEREERDERDEADDPDVGEREESPRDPGERSDGETGEKEAGDGPGPLPFPTRPRIVVDAEDYRARRHLGILVKILAMASRAVTTGKPQGIPQLTNPERRVVRVVVKQLKLVGMTTQGTGALKNITIFSTKEK
jgi:predicted RNA-binding protein Jag